MADDFTSFFKQCAKELVHERFHAREDELRAEYREKVLAPGMALVKRNGTFQLTEKSKGYPLALMVQAAHKIRKLPCYTVTDRNAGNTQVALPYYEVTLNPEGLNKMYAKYLAEQEHLQSAQEADSMIAGDDSY